jgi:hypothetical protein
MSTRRGPQLLQVMLSIVMVPRAFSTVHIKGTSCCLAFATSRQYCVATQHASITGRVERSKQVHTRSLRAPTDPMSKIESRPAGRGDMTSHGMAVFRAFVPLAVLAGAGSTSSAENSGSGPVEVEKKFLLEGGAEERVSKSLSFVGEKRIVDRCRDFLCIVCVVCRRGFCCDAASITVTPYHTNVGHQYTSMICRELDVHRCTLMSTLMYRYMMSTLMSSALTLVHSC